MREKKFSILFPACLLLLLFFAIPIEHKYDKLFRFYSLTLVPSGLELPPHFDKKISFYASDLIALILFGFGLWQIRRNLFDKGGPLLALFFFAALASQIASPLSHYAIPYIRLLQLLTPIALFLFLANTPLVKETLFKIFTGSLFATGLIQSLIAILQYFAQRPLGLRLFNEQPFSSSLGIPDGRRWIFDLWTNRVAELPMIYRSMGTMTHANMLGGLLALTLLTTNYLFLTYPKYRKWLAPAFLIQLFALATTYSRAAIIAYALGTLIFFGWLWARHRIFSTATALLVFVSTLLVGSLLHEQYLHRGGIVNYTPTARSSDAQRFIYQDIAFTIIKKHPFAGLGYGQFSVHGHNYYPEGLSPAFKNSGIHNIYLLIAAEMGLIALAAFLGWIITLLFAAVRSPSSPEIALLTGALIAFLFIGCCDFYPILFQQGRLLLFGTAGLLARFLPLKKNYPFFKRANRIEAYDPQSRPSS